MSGRLVLRHQRPAAEPEQAYALPGTSSPWGQLRAGCHSCWLYLGAVLLYVDLDSSVGFDR
jgi:hypothetical protein